MKNTKVYFAAAEALHFAVLMSEMGVNYALYTSAHWINDILRLPGRRAIHKADIKSVYRYLSGSFKNTIIDSGIFTIISNKHLQNEKIVHAWYDAYVKFISDNNIYSTLVEMDAQTIIGAEKTWELRKDFCNIFRDREIINVFHAQDGMKGLDRLIEYSPYIAVSFGEQARLKNGGKESLYRIVDYIRNKKPEIKIHMLGWTSKGLLERKICDTCDSTSWNSTGRFRTLFGKKIRISETELNSLKTKYSATLKKVLPIVSKNPSKEMIISLIYLMKGIETSLRYYEHYAGDQS